MTDSDDFAGRPCKGAEGICKCDDKMRGTLGLGGRAATGRWRRGSQVLRDAVWGEAAPLPQPIVAGRQ